GSGSRTDCAQAVVPRGGETQTSPPGCRRPIVSSRAGRGRPIGQLGKAWQRGARSASRQLLLQRGRSLTQRPSLGPLAQADDRVGTLLLADLQDGLPRRLAGLEGRVIEGL